MSEKVDSDHCATGIFEQIGESTLLPSGMERSTPSMNENDGVFHIGQDTP